MNRFFSSFEWTTQMNMIIIFIGKKYEWNSLRMMSPIIYRGKRADYTAYNFKPLEHPLSGWNLFASQFPILTCVFASRSPKKDTLEKFKWFNSCRNLDWWSINLHENCMGSSVSVGWQWSDFLLWLWKHKCNKRFFFTSNR